MIRWFEHHQVYAPSSKMVASGADLGRPFEDVYFTTSDGVRLNGWFFPADKTAPRSHLVFLLLHGNANNISQQLQGAGLTGVTVKVIGSRAYLSGEVKTELDRERAVSITQGAAPVVVGTNLIRVVPGNMFGF